MRDIESLIAPTLRADIRLVGVSKKQTTGLSRYGRALFDGLHAYGIHVSTIGTKTPTPQILTDFASKAGFDLTSFFTTYPLQLRFDKHSITHLTSQNQASAIAFGTAPRTVVTVHDLITLVMRHDPEITGYMTAYAKAFDNLAARGVKKAAAILADSTQTKQDIIEHLHYPADRITVVHLGVDHTNFKPLSIPEEFYARYNVAAATPYVLYVGSEDPRKNMRRLIEAFALLTKRVPEARLLKVGAARFAQERHALIAHATRLGVADKIQFYDQVSDSDLAYFYNVATVFVFPSLYEGFGWPPLEAMACGTPVIVSDRASLPEIVGDAARQVDPYNVEAIATEMEQVLSNTDLQVTLRARSLLHAAQFTWERTVRETVAVYASL